LDLPAVGCGIDLREKKRMRFTTKSRYGIRLVLDLAVHGRDKPVPLGDVSRRQNISLKYLEQLIGRLKKGGFIVSQRGPFGGHRLSRDPGDIRVGDIVRTLEGATALTDCVEEGQDPGRICPRAGECPARRVWIGASRAMFGHLDALTVGSLMETEPGLP
jgi:Rrf2 family protein